MGLLSSRTRLEGSPRPISRRKRFLGSERGTALVEFALIAPILFLLLFGMIEFGRALNYYNDLTQLAGQGARAAAVSANPDGTAVGNDPRCPSTANSNPSAPVGNVSIQCQIANTYPTDGSLKSGISVCLGTLNADNSISAPTSSPTIGSPITVRTRFTYNFLTHFFGFSSITLSSTQTERLEAPVTWQGGNVAGSGGGDACSA